MAARVSIIVDAKDNTGGVFRSLSSDVKSAIGGIKTSFTEVNSLFQLVGQGLQVIKQGYNFAKEGAQLEFTTQKFDRLAQTIGTTGEALREDLLEATRGTMSEMEAMASATDLISLGLVKTEKDAVRLSAVVSGLGMDMNQLVLALSNQTTMRFDQLGVAVVGFDEKVKKLEATGLSAQDAFSEAFLQQAEEQLVKVGNAADTSAGQFMKMEAELKNTKAELQMFAATLIAPQLPEFTEDIKAATWQLTNLSAILGEMGRLRGEGFGGFIVGLKDLGNLQAQAEANIRATQDAIISQAAAVEIAADRYDEMNAALIVNTETAELNTEQLKEINEANKNFLGVLGSVDTAMDTYYEGLATVNQELVNGKITTEEHAAKVDELARNYQQASADIVLSIVEMKLAADGWTDAELKAYLDIGKAQGKFTQDTVNAAKGAIESADDMVAAYMNLDEPLMHVGERAEDTAYDFGLMEMAGYDLAEAAYEAAGGVGATKSQLQGMPPSGSMWRYTFDIQVNGRVPTNLPNQTAAIGSGQADQFEQHNNQMGGEVYAGRPTIVGEAGAEPFIPSQNGRILGHAESLHALSMGSMGGGSQYFYGPVTIMRDTDTGNDFLSLR